MLRMRIVVPLLVTALLAVPVATASAHERGSSGGTKITLGGGATTLALDPGAADALTGLGLTVSPIDEAAVTDGGIAFPIRSGSIDLRSLTAAISHKGGLRIASATTTVDLLRPRIVLDGGLFLTARVGADRIKIADLKLKGVGVKLALPSLTLSNVGVELSDEAAAALNAAFGTDALAGGLKLGTASVTTSITGIGSH